ncbi:MAG: hypothetical protein PHV74_14605 [Dehalococcoidia bacterium]|nr:hypothetical protein [Dehalococcoidia bacterium]
MYWLKSCQKCRGDLYLAQDTEGLFITCLQCSARTYIHDPNQPENEAALDLHRAKAATHERSDRQSHHMTTAAG